MKDEGGMRNVSFYLGMILRQVFGRSLKRVAYSSLKSGQSFDRNRYLHIQTFSRLLSQKIYRYSHNHAEYCKESSHSEIHFSTLTIDYRLAIKAA